MLCIENVGVELFMTSFTVHTTISLEISKIDFLKYLKVFKEIYFSNFIFIPIKIGMNMNYDISGFICFIVHLSFYSLNCK